MLQFQLHEILRTPLQELCLHIKKFAAWKLLDHFWDKGTSGTQMLLQFKMPIERLKTIGALDDMEELLLLVRNTLNTSGLYWIITFRMIYDCNLNNFVCKGRHLCTLPLDPNIGKMLLMGSIFQLPQSCRNNIATALAYRNPLFLPINRKEEDDAAKISFAGDSCSDHIALLKPLKDGGCKTQMEVKEHSVGIAFYPQNLADDGRYENAVSRSIIRHWLCR
ncbi:hypothetical protein SLA2020_335300 [Shorea laevis]